MADNFQKDFPKDSKKDFASNGLKLFLSYYKPHIKLFIGDMICATFIAVVDEKGIAESGTHAKLISRGGIYRELYEVQFELER